ncbi:MAG: hypothetical protein JOZ55_11320, partial [Alphaproteobacteria bacterium]|nr:hypothetical protein [Alphaproteobacteria bacterium]
MYRQPQDAVDDPVSLHAAIRNHPFAVIARARTEEVEFAYAPVVLDEHAGPLGGV